MKKLLILSAVFFACLNITCKCGCFDPTPPSIVNLVIKNVAGEDLLNPSVNGSYSKAEIKLYKKSASNISTPIKFEINVPIPTGDKKIDYYQLSSQELMSSAADALNRKSDTTYLQLRNERPYKIVLELDGNSNLSFYMGGYVNLQDERWPRYNRLYYFIKR